MPRGLLDRPASSTPVVGEHRREHGHRGRLALVEPSLDPFEAGSMIS
jgi:hypothetical protein